MQRNQEELDNQINQLKSIVAAAEDGYNRVYDKLVHLMQQAQAQVIKNMVEGKKAEDE